MTVLFDFETAFDTPPHEHLTCKLFIKTLKWMYSFRCYRYQRVVVNSERARVLSGVPHVIVLGPQLFMYINDISTTDIDSDMAFS